jgi:hypothetical protein
VPSDVRALSRGGWRRRANPRGGRLGAGGRPSVWAILGQASGAYVGPTCWAVLFLAGAAAVLHQRGAVAAATNWQHPTGEWRVASGPVAAE